MNNWIIDDGFTEGETVKMSCQLWGKDIEINRQRRLGMTNIEILSK